MRARKAQAIRFAILTARAKFEPERLTTHQQGLLMRNDLTELMVGDRWTTKAHDRELSASKARWLKWDPYLGPQK